MIPPAEWYSQQDLSQHFMRRTDRPFEEGVSRGQLRRIAKCESVGMEFRNTSIYTAYAIIAENRRLKGRTYGISLHDWTQFIGNSMGQVYFFECNWAFAVAAAIIVDVGNSSVYVSAWSDTEGMEEYSPVCLLARGIYSWCQTREIAIMDIGIGGEPSLDDFKRRLGFRLPEEGM